MENQSGLNQKEKSSNPDGLDWVCVISLIALLFSLLVTLFLRYASEIVKAVDFIVVGVSLIALLFTLPISGREGRIAKIRSFFKKA